MTGVLITEGVPEFKQEFNHLLFLSTPGTPWSFRVIHGDKELWRADKETRRHRTGFGGTL